MDLDFGGFGGNLLNQVWIAGPMLLVMLVAVFGIAILWMIKTRRGPFYWRGAVPAPIVFNIEGDNAVPLLGGDKFRKTENNGTTWFESKRFGDKFPAGHLEKYTAYKPSAFGGEKPFMLVLSREAKGVWVGGSWRKRADGEYEGTPNPNDIAAANEAMTVGIDYINRFYGKSTLEQIAPYAMFGLTIIGIIIVVMIVTQFLTAALTQHLGAITASTDATIRLTNLILNMTNSTGGVPMPPA